MKPLPFVWPYALLFWAVMVWAFAPEFRIVWRAQRAPTAKKDRSLAVILLGGQISYVVAFLIAPVRSMQFPAAYQVSAFYLGIGTIVAGSLLRRHCWRMLGASFTGEVRASADQEVVTRGAYSILRHPSYTAGIILSTGMGIALGSWGSAALLAISSFAAYSYRMMVEERALVAAIGEPYRVFMSTRKRIIPFVY
jgi:protein-S-isoprenylcysteine O-methyltransferase Ste14